MQAKVRNVSGTTQIIDGYALPPRIWKSVPEDISLSAAWKAYQYQSRRADLEFTEGDGVFWMGPFSMGDGYATANENMVWALIEQGVDIFAEPCWFRLEDELSDRTRQLLQKPLTKPMRIGVCMATPGEFHKLPTPYRIGVTMYEADEPLDLHPEWRHDCAMVDRLVVPSPYCADIFEPFFKGPIDVVPLAVNPLYYTAQKREPKSTFTFVTYATLSPRKAPLETLEAFCEAFPYNEYPDVRLEFKTRNGVFGWKENMLPTITDPRITIHNATWTPEEVRDWLHKADAFLFLSKGEGFGMPPREAMATGLPTIVADHTGLSTFCDGDYNWPVPTLKTEYCDKLGTWRIPDWDYAIDCMRAVYFNREDAYERGQKGAEWFIKNHGAAAAAKQMKKVLGKKESIIHNDVSYNEQPSDLSAHEPFYEMLKDVPDPIMILGLGTGQACTALRHRNAFVYVEPEDYQRAVEICAPLHMRVMVGNPFDLSNLPRIGGIVSQGQLQKYTMQETRRMLKEAFRVCRKVFFSVPSAFYPEVFGPEARPYRLPYWHEVLRGYEAPVRYYNNKQHIMGRIVSEGSPYGPSGGRILDGEWHQR